MINTKEINVNREKGLSGNAMKIIAIIAMTCDHIAMAFIPQNTIINILIYQILRAFGRFTAIIMCYMATDGYHYTHNLSKYMTRLLILAVVSHFAYSFIHSGNLLFTEINENGYTFQTSVIWPILTGIMVLYIYNHPKINLLFKIIIIIPLLIFSAFSDWNLIAVGIIFFSEILRNDKKKKFLVLTLLSVIAAVIPIVFHAINNPDNWYGKIYMLGIFIALLFLQKYNGKRGKANKFSKWIFYIYYPAHMFIIGLIYMLTYGF